MKSNWVRKQFQLEVDCNEKEEKKCVIKPIPAIFVLKMSAYYICCIYTCYYNSNMIMHTVSLRADEVI